MADITPAILKGNLGTLFLSLGPKLQGKLCRQPNYVAFICKTPAGWETIEIHLHVFPMGRVDSGRVAVTPQDNRRRQDIKDGIKLGEGDTALVVLQSK